MIGDLIFLSPSIAFCTVYIGGIILKGVLALFDLWKKCQIEEERRIIGVSCEGYCGSQGKYVFGEVYADIKYSLQGTTQGRYLTGGVPPVRFSM